MNEDYDISDNSDSDVSLTNKKNAGRVFSEHPDDENEEMDVHEYRKFLKKIFPSKHLNKKIASG